MESTTEAHRRLSPCYRSHRGLPKPSEAVRMAPGATEEEAEGGREEGRSMQSTTEVNRRLSASYRSHRGLPKPIGSCRSGAGGHRRGGGR